MCVSRWSVSLKVVTYTHMRQLALGNRNVVVPTRYSLQKPIVQLVSPVNDIMHTKEAQHPQNQGLRQSTVSLAAI